MNKKNIHILFFAFIFILIISGCGRQNASFIKQGYHDLTARYNSNFNAKEKYKLSLKAIKDSRIENFDQLLPLFDYGVLEDTKKSESEFDIVIEKASTSIQLHKISNWSDDNFLLLGKAFYMKGDYEKASESLRYVTANYKEGVDGRGKKKIKKQNSSKKRKAKAKKQAKRDLAKLKDGKDIRPKKGFLKHSPAKSEALIWLVKTYTAAEKFNEAQAVLDYINLDNTFIQNYDRDKKLAQAEYLIKQNLQTEAIPHIVDALGEYKRNRKKARLKFVLAQLFEKTGNKAKAALYYKESTKGNNNYDMVFNATLKSLKLSNSKKNADDNDKMLAKLIRDSKNVDYLDQLYYERALIAQSKFNTELAKEHLAKSIESSTKNEKQKAKSLVLLGDIFYKEENYTPAQENYASAVTLVDSEFENYTVISKRAAVLTDLVSQLNTISKNDSLLSLANLSPEKMEKMLYEQAENAIAAERKASNSNKIVDQFAQNDKKQNNVDWYFYSENALKSGFNSFKIKWGDRKLEDDWRRANKSTGNTAIEDQKSEDEIYEEKVEALFAQLLAEVPTGDSGKLELKKSIVKAHHSAANIYKYDLENEIKAIVHFNSIVNDFADSSYEPESLYNLYILNQDKNKTAATKNKNLVLQKYPESKYAKIISDPTFAESLKSEDKKVDLFYEQTYMLYASDNFGQVIANINESRTKFVGNNLSAKFDLLEAVTFGKQKKYQAYVDALEAVITTHNGTEEEAKATEILAYLKGNEPVETNTIETTTKKIDDTKTEESLFDPNKGKDKEGFKVNFGKQEILKVGTNDEQEKSTKQEGEKSGSEGSELKKK